MYVIIKYVYTTVYNTHIYIHTERERERKKKQIERERESARMCVCVSVPVQWLRFFCLMIIALWLRAKQNHWIFHGFPVEAQVVTGVECQDGSNSQWTRALWQSNLATIHGKVGETWPRILNEHFNCHELSIVRFDYQYQKGKGFQVEPNKVDCEHGPFALLVPNCFRTQFHINQYQSIFPKRSQVPKCSFGIFGFKITREKCDSRESPLIPAGQIHHKADLSIDRTPRNGASRIAAAIATTNVFAVGLGP